MLRALPRAAMTCEAARSHIYRAACMHQLQGVWLQQREYLSTENTQSAAHLPALHTNLYQLFMQQRSLGNEKV